MADEASAQQQPSDADSQPTGPYRSVGLAAEVPGTVIAGKYKLLQRIGEGGMGSVWMADQLEPVKRRVAVKLIRPERGSSRSILARFEAERQAIALMDHPNIAKLLDAGEAPPAGDAGAPRPFFVMELVKGIPLTEFCDQHRLGITERLHLFMQVCSAVQHAHQKGIIHRDLKPGNILVESHDSTPVPRVIDFGLAKAVSGQPLTEHTLFTAFGTVAGTPAYMAPEQAVFNAIDVDTRADIYSLGVVLYELLAGTTPIEREQLKKAALDEILRVIRESDPPTPSKRLSSSESRPSIAANRGTEPVKLSRFLRGDLDWIVMKALEKDRGRRYATANGLSMDIQRYLADEPALAGPPGAAYRMRKFVKRNRPQVIAAGLVLVALLLGIAGTSAGLVYAVNARQAERTQRQIAEQNERDARAAKVEAEAATAAEKNANEQARRRLKQVEKGVEILASVFQDLNPRGEQRELTGLRVLLGRKLGEAVRQLEDDSVGNPVDVARLQLRLANALLELGYIDRAELVASKAQRTLASQLGPDAPDSLQAQHDATMYALLGGKTAGAVERLKESRKRLAKALGPDDLLVEKADRDLAIAYRLTGQPGPAIPILEQVREARLQRLGRDDPEVLITGNQLGLAYQEDGRINDAIPVFEQVRQGRLKVYGPTHPATLNALNNLGSAYQIAGRSEEAIAVLEPLSKVIRKELGDDHPDTANALNNLALALRDVRRMTEAIALLEQVRDIKISKLTLEHQLTLRSLDNLAGAYKDAGRMNESIALFQQVLDIRARKFGRGHSETLLTINNLANAYREAGKLDQALPLQQEAVDGVAKVGYAHQFADRFLANLARCQEQLKQLEQAEATRRKALEVARQKFGTESTSYANALEGLGGNLLLRQKPADAEPILRQCLTLRERFATSPKSGMPAWQLPQAKSLLGGALAEQKRFTDAEPLLLDGYRELKQNEAKIPLLSLFRVTEALERLVRLYDAWGKPEQAAKWR